MLWTAVPVSALFGLLDQSDQRTRYLCSSWMGLSEIASGCKYLDQSRNRLISRLAPLRHSPVPVGEILFAIGFTSGVEEACRCSAFVQDVLRGYSVGGTTNAVLASYMLLVVIVAQQAITFRGTWRLVFQLAWKGCYESWCASPNLYTPLAHAVRDPHCSGLDTWLVTLGFRWTSECILAASFLAFIAFLFLTGFVTHIIVRHVLRPFSFWFRNLLARIKHNAIGLLGVFSFLQRCGKSRRCRFHWRRSVT